MVRVEALKRNPEDIASWTDLGEVYVYMMDFAHAAQALEQALKLDPAGENPWGRRAWAVLYRRHGHRIAHLPKAE